jgi:hypothetical protein
MHQSPTGDQQSECIGSVFSIYAFGNGPNSAEFLAVMNSGGENAAFLIGTDDTAPLVIQNIFTLLSTAYATKQQILISFIRIPGNDPRITGAYAPSAHYPTPKVTDCAEAVKNAR